MDAPEPFMLRAARWLAFASSVAIVIGIAPSQILLGMALVALLLSGEKLQLPPIKLPLGLFLLGTLIAIAFSGNAVAGLPQVKKIYVFFQLLVVFGALSANVLVGEVGIWYCFANARDVGSVILANCAGVGTLAITAVPTPRFLNPS